MKASNFVFCFSTFNDQVLDLCGFLCKIIFFNLSVNPFLWSHYSVNLYTYIFGSIFNTVNQNFPFTGDSPMNLSRYYYYEKDIPTKLSHQDIDKSWRFSCSWNNKIIPMEYSLFRRYSTSTRSMFTIKGY